MSGDEGRNAGEEDMMGGLGSGESMGGGVGVDRWGCQVTVAGRRRPGFGMVGDGGRTKEDFADRSKVVLPINRGREYIGCD